MKTNVKIVIAVVVILVVGFLAFSFFSRPNTALALLNMGPGNIKAGEGFNVQPNGDSAIWVSAKNATKSTVVFWGETKLVTTFGTPTFLTALVPQNLYASPGKYELYLVDENNGQKSNVFNVTVK
jgi:hypothetical protein